VPTHFEGAEDGHEDGLGLGTFLAAIRVAVLPDQDGGADPPLPGVVVRRHLLMVQEGEQLFAVAPQSLLQPPGMFFLPPLVDELVQTFSDSYFSPFGDFLSQTLLVFLQPHAVPDQAAKPPVKLRPVPAGIMGMPSPAQVTQQVRQALLFGKAGDRVVCTPEVGQLNPIEAGAEQFLQNTTAPSGIDQVVHGIPGRQAPQPGSLPLYPPTRLIGVQHSLALDLLQNPVVPLAQDLSCPMPCLHTPAFRHREMQVIVVDIQNLAECCALQVVHHPGQTVGPVPDLAVRQGVLDNRLHLLPAVGAPVPGDHMFVHRGSGILLDVLDDPRTT